MADEYKKQGYVGWTWTASTFMFGFGCIGSFWNISLHYVHFKIGRVINNEVQKPKRMEIRVDEEHGGPCQYLGNGKE